MKPRLLVLDQWASHNTQAGTSKNWLYEGFSEVFASHIVNADTPLVKRLGDIYCLFRGLLSRPTDLRNEYYRQLEWSTKTPAAFKARTIRFQRASDRFSEYEATFQVGSLFGPISSPGKAAFSYHDQTVSMVERLCPDWLPRNFSRFRDIFFELERASLQAKDLVFTYSEFTRRSMIEDYGLPPHRVMVAPTACKIPFPAHELARRERAPKLLFANTNFHQKGGDLVFQAFRELYRQRPELELILAGGVAPEPLPEGARHLGMVSMKELVAEYLSATIILHPARHDAYPNVLKEALACGLPAVTSASVGIPEIVTHGETGIVLQHADVPSIVDAVASLLDGPENLRSMRERCLIDRERFKPKNCVARITEAMCGVINEKGIPHA
jgi:glycosyltransferase involved in cell wall biosynthesis